MVSDPLVLWCFVLNPHCRSRDPKLLVPFLGPLGYECAQHRQTPRPSVDGTRSKALRPFGSQQRISKISPTVQMARGEWLKGGPQTGI